MDEELIVDRFDVGDTVLFLNHNIKSFVFDEIVLVPNLRES